LFLIFRGCIENNKLIIVTENKIKMNSVIFQFLNSASLIFLFMNDFTLFHLIALPQLMLNLFILPLVNNEIRFYKRIGIIRIFLNITSILFIQIVNFPIILDLLIIKYESLINNNFTKENFEAIFNKFDNSKKKNYIFYFIYVFCLLVEGLNYKFLTFKSYNFELENELLNISITGDSHVEKNQVLVLLNAEIKYSYDDLFYIDKREKKDKSSFSDKIKTINDKYNESDNLKNQIMNKENSNKNSINAEKYHIPNNIPKRKDSCLDIFKKFRIDLFYYKENILRISIILMVIIIHNIFSMFYVLIFLLSIIWSINNFLLNYLKAVIHFFIFLVFSFSYSYPELLKYNDSETPSYIKNLKYILDYSSDLPLITKILIILIFISINILIFNVQRFDSKTAIQELNNKTELKEKFLKQYRKQIKTHIIKKNNFNQLSFETLFIEKIYKKNNLIAKKLLIYISKFFTLFVLPFFSKNNFYDLGKNTFFKI